MIVIVCLSTVWLSVGQTGCQAKQTGELKCQYPSEKPSSSRLMSKVAVGEIVVSGGARFLVNSAVCKGDAIILNVSYVSGDYPARYKQWKLYGPERKEWFFMGSVHFDSVKVERKELIADADGWIPE